MIRDELYLEEHRGTYTNKAIFKKLNRRMEHILRDAELLAAVQADFVAPPATTVHEAEVPEEQPDVLAWEWNERGGVIHWTHHDPQGRHPEGWIRYRGDVYE